jgi:hypothetical protein
MMYDQQVMKKNEKEPYNSKYSVDVLFRTLKFGNNGRYRNNCRVLKI